MKATAKTAKKTVKTASAFSLLTPAQKHIVRQRAAFLAHTHKTFQSDRTVADRKDITKNLTAFDRKHTFLRKYLAA